MNELFLAFRNVLKRRISFRLTSLSIMIGLASVIMISSAGESGKTQILSTVEGIGMKGVMFTHTASVFDGRGFDTAFCQYVEEKNDYQVNATPFSLDYTDVMLAERTYNALIWGIGENAENYINVQMLYGRMPGSDEIQSGAPVAVVTEGIARQVFGRANVVGQQLVVGKGSRRTNYQIIGVAASSTGSLNMFYADIPDFVYAPYTALKRYSAIETGRMMVISDRLSADEIKSAVKAAIYSSYGSSFKLDVTNFDEGRAGVDQVASLLTLMLSFAASVSLAVAGIGIMSTMLQTVTERRREIGMMKALGATGTQIAKTFLWESILVCLYGLVLGVGVGIAALLLLSRFTLFEFTVNWQIFLLAIAFSAVSGLFCGALPALKAAGEDPIDALKNE